MHACWLGSELLHKVCEIMSELSLPIMKAFLFVNAISTLISLSHHSVQYKNPFCKLLASTNVNLYKVALLSGQAKEDIPLFINQHKRTNFADLLMKFNIESEKPTLISIKAPLSRLVITTPQILGVTSNFRIQRKNQYLGKRKRGNGLF